MRITFISTLTSYWGGSEELWVQAAALAMKRGHDVQVVVYGQPKKLHPKLLQLKKTAVSFVEMKPNLPRSSIFGKIRTALTNRLTPVTFKAVSKFNPDHILVSQVHSYSAPFHPQLYDFLRKHKSPFHLISQFNSEHNCLTYPDIQKARLLFRKAEQIFFVSKRNHSVAERQLAQTISNFKIVDNPLNLQDLSYVPVASNLLSIQFASVARLEVNFKGQDILFQVLAEPQWKNRNWHLNVYGDGPDARYLEDLATFYMLAERVTFHGRVDNIRALWAANHILLMPSTSEGKPLALQEAMVCGRVAVASDVAGISELIENDVDGFIASSFFAVPFSEAMEKAWARRNSWEKMGQVAHDKMMACLDLEPHQTIISTLK